MRTVPSPEPAPRAPPGSWENWAATGLLFLHAVGAWLGRRPAITAGNDDAVYLLLARALRHFSYRELFAVGTPIHSQYPPLYPALLAVVSGLGGERLGLLTAVNVLCSTAGLALLYVAARRSFSTAALAMLAIAAVNPSLLAAAGQLRSEPLFVLLVAVVLAALGPGGARPRPALAVAAAIGAALTRSIGITVVVAVLAHLVVTRRWRAAAGAAMASIAFVGSWLVWTVVAPSQVVGRSYVADLAYAGPRNRVESSAQAPVRRDSTLVPGPAPSADSTVIRSQAEPVPRRRGLFGVIGARLAHNVPTYLTRRLPGALAVPVVEGTRVDNWLWLGVIGATIVAGMVVLGRRWPVCALLLASYGGLLAIWPYALGRYLTPMVPVIALAMVIGAERMAQFGRRLTVKAHPWVAALLAVAMLAGAAPRAWTAIRQAVGCDRTNPLLSPSCVDPLVGAFYQATIDLARSSPPTTRFLAAKEGPFYFYTGRQVLPIGPLVDRGDTDLVAYLSEHQVEHILLSHLKYDEWALIRRLSELCGRLELVREWGPGTLLVRLVPIGTPVATDASCQAIARYNDVAWEDRAPMSLRDR